MLQLLHDVGHRDAGEVINLATRQDGGDNLLFLSGGENEDGIVGRFLKGLKESIERRLRQHVNLIDDKNAVAAYLGRNEHLVGKVADVLHRVVARRVELQDIVGALLVKRQARLALVARLAVGTQALAVDSLGKDARAGGLAHAARPAKQIGMRQLLVLDSCLKSVSESLLPTTVEKLAGRYFRAETI